MIERYRIIRESDGNGIRHYEIEFQKRKLFGGYKWVPVREPIFPGSYPRQFKDRAECLTYLKSLDVRREVVDQDEIRVSNH